MAPNIDGKKYPSTSGLIYPKNRDSMNKSQLLWLSDKRLSDGAENYWRIHDGLYDLTNFIDEHPGGKSWLQSTQGTDITEAFEVHHLKTTAYTLLPNFFVKKAVTPRNSPFTFEPNGFYKTLKSRVAPVLKNAPQHPVKRSKFIADSVLTSSLLMSILAAYFSSYIVAVIAGVLLSTTAIIAHNYFHRRDNFRMYYFDFSMLSYREWRISHALSHHLYTNTIADLELSIFEPILEYLPHEKSLKRRITSWIILPIVWLIACPLTFIKRIVTFCDGTDKIQKSDFLPFLIPLIMYFFGGQSLSDTLTLWAVVIFATSFHFAMIGLNAAHHHPEIFHEGDKPRAKSVDWGIHQLDAVMDRKELTGSHFLVITNFGDHGLHHLFPTVDHGLLQYLYPVFTETCKEFNIELRMNTQLNLIKGQFNQLIRQKPNPNPPNLSLNFTPR